MLGVYRAHAADIQLLAPAQSPRTPRFKDHADAVSVGVLLTPRTDGLRDWDTTMATVIGDPELTDDELQQDRELWNTDL